MSKSLVLAFAALALSAGAAFANPAGDAQLPQNSQMHQTVDTPSTHGSGNSQALPSFNYGTKATVTGNAGQAGNGHGTDSTLPLVNRTGSGQ